MPTGRPAHAVAALAPHAPRQLLRQRAPRLVVVGGQNHADGLVDHVATVPQVGVLFVLVRRRNGALRGLRRRPIRYADGVVDARLVQRQLVHLALHEDHLVRVLHVVQPVQDLLGSLHLPEALLWVAVLDVDDLPVAVVRERDGPRYLTLQRGTPNVVLLPHPARLERGGADAPRLEELQRLRLQRHQPRAAGPHGRLRVALHRAARGLGGAPLALARRPARRGAALPAAAAAKAIPHRIAPALLDGDAQAELARAAAVAHGAQDALLAGGVGPQADAGLVQLVAQRVDHRVAHAARPPTTATAAPTLTATAAVCCLCPHVARRRRLSLLLRRRSLRWRWRLRWRLRRRRRRSLTARRQVGLSPLRAPSTPCKRLLRAVERKAAAAIPAAAAAIAAAAVAVGGVPLLLLLLLLLEVVRRAGAAGQRPATAGSLPRQHP
mmetsp:Transcript_26540/g.68731  ORF Transcript_26540/g.68731 Transcript_26540/m.68731 type:complete len:438 (-) Transcript_26540:395-1708(-)